MDDTMGPQSLHPQFTVPLEIEKPIIPSLFGSFSQSAAVSTPFFGDATPSPISVPLFTENHMSFNVKTEAPPAEAFPDQLSNDPSLPITDISFSKFTRESQVNKLLSRLMQDAISNCLDWKSAQVRKQKTKRVRPASASTTPRPNPFVTVKKFKIIVKKSFIQRSGSYSGKKKAVAEENPVADLLSEQHSERIARELSRKKQFLELHDRLMKRDKYKFFHHPVDTKLVPDYLEVIQHPMDLTSIKKNILKNRYPNLDAFKSDIVLIFQNCFRYNAPQTIFYQQAESMLNYVERIFLEAKRFLEPEDTPPLIHPYEELETCSVMNVDAEILHAKLSTNKRGCCDGQHCSTFDAIGAFDVNKGKFESLAPDRSNLTECGPDCACDPNVCLNRGVTLNQSKKLEHDIEKRNVYGIDSHTHALIRKALSAVNGTTEDFATFIEQRVLPYINMYVPNDEKDRRKVHMLHSMKALVADSLKENDTVSHNFAQSLIDNIKKGLSLPVYDKGHGVVCTNPNGFKKNEFIVEYMGEVYPPWRWFEKQAVLKQFQKVYMMPFSFGFYNILLERHKDDLQGYDVLYVDACRKGNFASRLSHSCSPNCTSVVVAANGRFAIVVLALRDILPNEELTFDYHSVTESPDEAKNALCFCGWSICRGRYVQYAGPDQFQQILNVHHGFTQRTAILLRACSEPLTSDDHDRLLKWHLCGSVLDGLPEWAVKFAALILEYVDFEKEALPAELMLLRKFYYTQETAECDTLGVTEGRVQCLAVVLDKIKYILRECGNITDPPLKILSNEEVIDRIWNAEDSVISLAAKKIGPLLDDVDLVRLAECTNCKVASRREMVSRLIEFRDLLRSMQPSFSCFHHVAADIVHMYAYTDTFYSMTNYPIVKSPPFHFSELGLNVITDDESLLTPKPYTQAFIWGALMFWYKQSLDRPDAAAHNAKRGTVCLPSIEGCYSSSTRNELVEKYTYNQREAMIASLATKPVGSIPRHAIWDYRSSTDRVYGSPLLDAVYKQKDLKPLIKGLQAWQPSVDKEGVFEVVQSPKRRRRRTVRP